MIGSIALVCVALGSAPKEVGRGIDVPWHDGGHLASDLLVRRDDEDDDDDEDERDADRERERDAQRELRDRDRSLREQRRLLRDQHRLRFQDHDDPEDEGDEPTARASGHDRATLAVNGPVTLRLRVQSGEIVVVPADKPQVSVVVSGTRLQSDLQLVQYGNRVELRVGGKALKRWNVRVEAPRGTNLDFDSTSGDVSVQGLGGDVRVRTMSGDVNLQGARKVDVETISGDVRVEASAKARLHTVSGNVVLATADPAAQIEFESASGNLDWSGTCAKGCHLGVETVSGDVKLSVDPRSSFELAYSSHSGELHDDLKLQMKRAPKHRGGEPGGWAEAVYGGGEGLIECDAFSGDLQIRRK